MDGHPFAAGDGFSLTIARRRAHAVDFRLVAPGYSEPVGPLLLERVLDAYPTLPDHACDTGGPTTFGAVIATGAVDLGHLLEHLAIDLEVRAWRSASAAVPVFAGNTSWIERERGVQRITLSYVTGQAAVTYEAMRQACRVVDAARLAGYPRTPRDCFPGDALLPSDDGGGFPGPAFTVPAITARIRRASADPEF